MPHAPMSVLHGIVAEHLDAARDAVWPHLARVAETSRGRYLTTDLWGFLQDGRLQIWSFLVGGEIRGIVLTEVVNFPRCREARLFGAAGRGVLAYVPEHLPTFFAWARAQGCSRLVAAGRRGWARSLPGMTWCEVALERDL